MSEGNVATGAPDTDSLELVLDSRRHGYECDCLDCNPQR